MYTLLGIIVLGFILLVVTDCSIISRPNRFREDEDQIMWITSYNNSSVHAGDIK